MITQKDIKTIVEAGEKRGFHCKIRDVAFVILTENLEDAEIAYKVAYGEECRTSIQSFVARADILFIRDYIRYALKSADSAMKADKMSFDENKKEMIKLLKETRQAMDEGTLEVKDGLNIMKDIRVKLNDKFNVGSEVQDRFIIVENKYNAVCACGREIYVPTVEELKEKYNLTEK